ncbi:MAG: sugar phosphate isomerase/epimerase [Chloroflexi bacterium]|nr:sugar phosphate isomerase/epimerase [Chloroflexota bacterium]
MTQIAAQLFTIRDFTKTREDFVASMAKIRDIGYQAVQVSQIGDIADADVKRICDDNGLTICNTHVSVDDLLRKPDAVIEQHRQWGARHVAIGGMPLENRESEAGFRRFAEVANGIGERLYEAGLTFSYHNHSFEFLRFGARSGLELIFDETDPCFVQAELDTYWIQHGGADPVAWIERMQDRMPVIHLKDMVMLPPPSESPPNKLRGDLRPHQAMAEVGEGNMNFAGILAACQRVGVEWYAVEQDICQRDPFESLAISYRNLRAMGLT